MTREEILRSMEYALESDKRTIKNPISEYGWLFDKIYKWKRSLEQEPCDDAISRQAALEQAMDYGSQTYLIPVNSVKALPSVTPQQKVGKWILTDVEGNRVWHCNCSECGKDPQNYIGGSENWWLIKNKLPNFCPNCGAKMEVSN